MNVSDQLDRIENPNGLVYANTEKPLVVWIKGCSFQLWEFVTHRRLVMELIDFLCLELRSELYDSLKAQGILLDGSVGGGAGVKRERLGESTDPKRLKWEGVDEGEVIDLTTPQHLFIDLTKDK
ncbi:hypothetical protein HDV00_010376, partial [Rhizophlyctis rosea]